MNSHLFTQTLPLDTSRLLGLFIKNKPDFLSSCYLSGGTALSLQLGHRESEDLNFFAEQPFEPKQIEQQLLHYGVLSETELLPDTINTYLNGVKLQFLLYPYRLIEPVVSLENVNLSSIIDIACTKLQTISMRGSKKDLVDLYFLLKLYDLETLFAFTKKKYIENDYNEAHILKSLVYFEDAENQPIPRMHQDVSWDEVKRAMIKAVKSVSLFNPIPSGRIQSS